VPIVAELIPVPQVAAGADEVIVTDWLVQIGDEMVAGTPIAVVETDKSTVEVEAPRAATLLGRLAEVGSRIEVGASIALIGDRAELDRDIDDLLAALGVDVTTGASGTGTDGENLAAAPDAGVDSTAGSGSVPWSPPATRRFVSPIARRLLVEEDIAIEAVSGTGPRGRVMRADVQRAVAARSVQQLVRNTGPASPDNSTAVPAGRAIPHTRQRLAIARRLGASKREVPHFYLRRTAVVDSLMALRAELNTHSSTRISVNDLVIRAVGAAYAAVPQMNVRWTDEALLQLDTVDVAVAVASQRGLVAPVLRRVDESSVSSIARSVRDLASRADSGRLRQPELEGGSITVSNLGMFGVEDFAAIINPPQSAILAVGSAVPTVRVVAGQPAVATVMTLVVSVDHRAVDGALASMWFGALITALEDPMRLVV